MATNSKSTVPAERAKLQGLVDGLSGSTNSLLNSLVVLGVTTAKADIIAKLRSYIALFTAVITARQAYSAAVVARKAVEAAMNAYYACRPRSCARGLARSGRELGHPHPTLLSLPQGGREAIFE